MILPEQIRAARALLGINQLRLAELAGVGPATIKRLEVEADRIRGTGETLWRIQSALEAQGVEFIAEGGGKGPGVRLAVSRRSLSAAGE